MNAPVILSPRTFESKILFFNGMYKLPVGPYPTTYEVIKHEKARNVLQHGNDKAYVLQRLQAFLKTIRDEINEGDYIVENLLEVPAYTEAEFLVDMADWLGDIQVYCASEMAKFGLPHKEIMNIIMASNFSKLDSDGKPLYDSHGKVEKGPMYWKPEPQIAALLQERVTEHIKGEETFEKGIVWR